MSESRQEKFDLSFTARQTNNRSARVSVEIDISGYLRLLPEYIDLNSRIDQKKMDLSNIESNISISQEADSIPKSKLDELSAVKHGLTAEISALEAQLQPFQDLRSKISENLLDHWVAEENFLRFMQQALNCIVPKLSEADKTAALNSSANKIFQRNFNELVKNSLDVIIMNHLRSEGTTTALLQIQIDLDLSRPEQLTIQMSDNGPGFPPELLNKLQSHDKIIEFCQHSNITERTSKRTASDHAMIPYLFGGQGKGLRIFLLQGATGQLLNGLKILDYYDPKDLIDLEITNAPDGGALLGLTTTLNPALDIRLSQEAEAAAALESTSGGGGAAAFVEDETTDEAEEEVELFGLSLDRSLFSPQRRGTPAPEAKTEAAASSSKTTTPVQSPRVELTIFQRRGLAREQEKPPGLDENKDSGQKGK